MPEPLSIGPLVEPLTAISGVKTPMPFYEQAGDKWRLPALKDVNWCTLDLQWLKLTPNEDGCNAYYAVLPEPVEATEGGKPRESLPPHVQRRMERKQAADDYRRAEELFKTGKLDDLYECERLLRDIKSNKYASPRLKDKADKLLASVLIKIDELEAQRAPETPEQPVQQSPPPALSPRSRSPVILLCHLSWP